MAFQIHTEHIDGGHVSTDHSGDAHSRNAVGGAMAWLAFYATAAVIAIYGNFEKAADIVVAGCQSCN